MDKREYHTLDGMRGVAAIAVMALHAGNMLHPAPHLLPGAYLAVDLFFVLSGFVLEHAYGNKLGSSMTARQFMVARYVRLYPLFALGALLGSLSAIVALLLGAGGLSPGGLSLAIATAVLLLPSPTWREVVLLFPVNPPGWSLAFEIVVNFAFAVLFRRLSSIVLIGIIIVSGTVLVAATLAVGRGDLGGIWTTALAGLPRVFFSFFAGVLLHRIHGGRRVEGVIGWIAPFALIPLFALEPAPSLRPIVDIVAVLILFPAAIAIAATYEPTKRGVSLFRYLGLISFPLYAIHYPVLEALRRGLRAIHLEANYESAAFLTCLVLILVSGLLAKGYDEPVRRRLRSLVRTGWASRLRRLEAQS